MTMGEAKQTFKEQFLLVLLDEARAIGAIPKLLPKRMEERREILNTVQRVIAARGALSEEGRRRLAEIEALFDVKAEIPAKKEVVHA